MKRAASPSMESLAKGDGDRLEGPLDTVSVLFSDPVAGDLPGGLVLRIRRGSRPAGRGGRCSARTNGWNLLPFSVE